MSALKITEDTISPNYQGKSMAQINRMKVFSSHIISPMSNVEKSENAANQHVDLSRI
jgi:hypothetical protein